MSFSPIEQARALYEHEPCARSFEEDLAGHLENGRVVVTSELFLLFREVDALAPYELVTDPRHRFEPAGCNAWLIYLLAGDPRLAIPYFPHPHILIGFERLNVLRWWPWAGFRRHLSRHGLYPRTSF